MREKIKDLVDIQVREKIVHLRALDIDNVIDCKIWDQVWDQVRSHIINEARPQWRRIDLVCIQVYNGIWDKIK